MPSQNLIFCRFSWLLLAIILLGGLSATVGVIFSNYPEVFYYIEGTNACSYAPQTTLNSIIVYSGYSLVILMQGTLFGGFSKNYHQIEIF